jgi:DNA repair protein RadC
VLAHNHPSGDATPSDSDRRSTRRLATAAEALDCTVLDHLVFAGGECASLRQLGYL